MTFPTKNRRRLILTIVASELACADAQEQVRANEELMLLFVGLHDLFIRRNEAGYKDKSHDKLPQFASLEADVHINHKNA